MGWGFAVRSPGPRSANAESATPGRLFAAGPGTLTLRPGPWDRQQLPTRLFDIASTPHQLEVDPSPK